MTDPTDTGHLTWDEIVEHCSRLHTTRSRPEGPWPDAVMREGSQMRDVEINGEKATVVPTRMHEPGFYVRLDSGEFYPIEEFQRDVERKVVTWL